MNLKVKFIFSAIFSLSLSVGHPAIGQVLKPYTCLIDRVDIHGFESTRTFDRNGIILSRGKYHPLSIVNYGILSYYYFLETSDSTYYEKFLDQAKYFYDSTKITLLYNGKGVGLPYTFKAHDLGIPWYSGMTQGAAISYLLRYYSITHDDYIKSLIQKIAYLLLLPQEDGGTISKTPEGYTWIEEYPNSKSSPQVLNGFINGFIGLKEYCDFFPDDTIASRILNETYIGLVNSLEYYDTPNWTYYNRKKTNVSNAYLRYQIYEMKHLMEIFNNPIFDDQMRIWSYFSYNNFIKNSNKHYKYRNHNISKPIKSFGNYGIYEMDSNSYSKIRDYSVKVFYSWRQIKRYNKKKPIKTNPKKSKYGIFSFESQNNDSVDYIQLQVNNAGVGIDIQLYNKVKGETNKYFPVEFQHYLANDSLTVFCDNISLLDLLISIEYKKGKVLTSLRDTANLYKTKKEKPPFFGHYQTDIYQLNANEKYSVELSLIGTDYAVVFYKYAKSEALINKSKWQAKNTLGTFFEPSTSGYYEFLIVFDWKSPISSIQEFNILLSDGLQDGKK